MSHSARVLRYRFPGASRALVTRAARARAFLSATGSNPHCNSLYDEGHWGVIAFGKGAGLSLTRSIYGAMRRQNERGFACPPCPETVNNSQLLTSAVNP